MGGFVELKMGGRCCETRRLPLFMYGDRGGVGEACGRLRRLAWMQNPTSIPGKVVLNWHHTIAIRRICG